MDGGLKGEGVSASLEPNRLLPSFFIDTNQYSIDPVHLLGLELVLHTLTKQHVEPLGEASLKLLTFKTVFL